MAHALVLTASSSGRTSLPSDAGFTLEVDGDSPVTLDMWPYPSTWIPDGVRLYRFGREISAGTAGDELRWVLTGDDRFGEFSALAIAAGRTVTSPLLVVRRAGAPATQPVTADASSPAAADASGPPRAAAAASPSTTAGLSAQAAPAGFAPPPAARSQTPGIAPRRPSDDLIDLSAGLRTSQAPTSPAQGPAAATPAPTHAGTSPAPPPSPPPSPPPTSPTGRIPAHASPTDLRALAEVPAGEYDGRFAAFVGALFTVAALGFAGLVVTRLLIDVQLTATEPVDPATALTSHEGTVAERVGLATAVLLIALGGVLLLAGAALAALEVRGRQRRTPSAPTSWRAQESGLRFIPAMLDRLNQIPAVIAVLVVGGIVLGLGLIGTLYWPTLF